MPRNPLAHPDLPRLSRRSFWIIVGIALSVFIIADNPLFGDPFSIDRSIIYSYAPIPLMVLIALMIERKLDVRTLLIETTLVVVVKFGITYVLATILWMAAGDPPSAPRLAVESPPATSVALDRAYSIEHVGPSDKPVVVSAVRDLDPRPIQVATEQLVALRPDSRGLHTARATLADGRSVFNLALPEGAERAVRFHRALGRVHISCLVHPEERYPDLIVVAPSSSR